MAEISGSSSKKIQSSAPAEAAVTKTTTTTTATTTTTTTVSSADVIRLILVHLAECGLQESCRVLRQESGVGMAASLQPPQFWQQQAESGDWATILDALSTLDEERVSYLRGEGGGGEDDVDFAWVVASVHEMVILELAEAGEWELAYASYRLVQNKLVEIMVPDKSSSDPNDKDKRLDESKKSKKKKYRKNDGSNSISMARLLELKLSALADQRNKDPNCSVPENFFGSNTSKQERRNEIGELLKDMIPRQPNNRLFTLIQQSIQWQTYTGQMPRIRRLWEGDEQEEGEEKRDLDENQKNRKSKRRRKVKEFDLVVGEVSVDPVTVGDTFASSTDLTLAPKVVELDKWATIKFGKKATPESAVFLPDGSGLITGSSDGLIEIWDASHKFTELRTEDLIYQKNEELLGHDSGTAITALAASNDGQLIASGDVHGNVNIWRFDSGKCLRSIAAHDKDSGAITCLQFSPDSGHILTASHDGTSREFGLRTARMMKEFRGHTAYLTSCAYRILSSQIKDRDDTNSPLLVVTGSGDGTVRIWNGKTADVIHVLRPVSLGQSKVLSKAGTSIQISDHNLSVNATDSGCPTIHSVLHLHTPSNTMIIVPRGQRAFHVNHQGLVLRVFHDSTGGDDKNENVFVAATVSANNRWLYLVKEDGVCSIFNVSQGTLESTIRDFGQSSTSKASVTTKDGTKIAGKHAEISTLIHHPTKNIVGAFSNEKGQKKGQLVLWK